VLSNKSPSGASKLSLNVSLPKQNEHEVLVPCSLALRIYIDK